LEAQVEFETVEGGYQRRRIVRGDQFEVVECRWSQGQESKDHGHGHSSCMVYVVDGSFENKSQWLGEARVEEFVSGQTIVTPLGARHSLKCISSAGATLHVYSPPLSLSSPEISKPKSETEISYELSDKGLSWSQLSSLLSQVRESSVPTHSVRFMNQLFAGVYPEVLLADQVSSQTRTTLATREASPVLSRVEDEVVQALCREIGWDLSAAGGVAVPGGSMANFMALHLARHRRFPEAKAVGLSGLPKLSVFVSEEAHYSLKKGAIVLGLGTDAIVPVRSDSLGCMDPKELAHSVIDEISKGRVPLAVVATAGTTVLGAFDPLKDLQLISKQHGMWFHVDAAWGGPALFSRELRPLVAGIELSDSVTFDAHKLFGASLTSSFLLAKQSDELLNANDVSGAEYLFHNGDEAGLDLGRISWQCGRGPDALSFWTLWKSRGRSGLAHTVDRLLRVRDELVAWILKEPRLTLIAEPSYLNVCVRITPPRGVQVTDGKWAVHARESLIKSKKAWVNYSSDSEGQEFLRMILVHPELDFADAKQVLVDALAVDRAD
jgi:sulfinoalanine decarboxylase